MKFLIKCLNWITDRVGDGLTWFLGQLVKWDGDDYRFKRKRK